jgi:hypothetical protein
MVVEIFIDRAALPQRIFAGPCPATIHNERNADGPVSATVKLPAVFKYIVMLRFA